MNYNYILVTLMFVALDIVTGLLQSFINGTFSSGKMRVGGKHKLFLIVVIAFGVCLDLAQKMIDLGFNIPCLNGICIYITFMEIMSIIENINKAFPNALPKTLVNTLKQVAEKNGVDDKWD